MLLNVQTEKQNWCSNVKYLLDTHGFSDFWENPRTFKTFRTDFKVRVVDVFKQNWYDNIINSSSLNLYQEFKITFILEKYLNNLPLSTRIAMSRFRLSSHHLKIETGRKN